MPTLPQRRPGSDHLELPDRAAEYGDRLALVTPQGEHRYRQLLAGSGRVARALLDGAADLNEARVAFLTEPGAAYVAGQWGAWRAGGVAVPLCVHHPEPELQYVVEDAGVSALAADGAMLDRLRPIADRHHLRLLNLDEITADTEPHTAPDENAADLPHIDGGRMAMMLYTSGSTGKPKGVVTTHGNVAAQVRSLVEAWAWSADDRILHTLPLHHIHGVINVLGCAMHSGAVCEMPGTFDPDARVESHRIG